MTNNDEAYCINTAAYTSYNLDTSSPELGAKVMFQRTPGADELNIGTILHHTLLLLELEVVLASDISESPLLGDNDLLAPRELVPRAAESLLDDKGVVVFAADGEDDLANVDTGNCAVGFAPSATHTGLEPISSSAGQHLVDSYDMEGMDTDTHVERILSGGLGNVFVGTNTSSLESFRGQLLVLVRDEMAAEREFIDGSTFTTKIVDTNLGIRDTAVVAGLRVGLVLAVAVAASGAATHFDRL
jgi:hypothetical protein